MEILNGLVIKSTVTRRSFLSKQGGVFVGGLLGVLTNNHNAVANAYPRRDVGSEGSRSAGTAAMNEQAYKTNNRLESGGFKFDTPKEEEERLSNALASFSYNDSPQNKKVNNNNGYRTMAKDNYTKSKETK
eukprot:CAMPEP_0194130286 /NCGR_PEP_ID=MMETSP0152-20130528/1358_1 /TAXON_ID=1049557 /ORGANISM="Thalassiothrix antarctica, Strain L6-D1" /LENGTH=130 /DNA_ID=CAMNT_0038824755 /DNA_START=232 /DNA_END=624 /DNA_ORIENTATION=+